MAGTVTPGLTNYGGKKIVTRGQPLIPQRYNPDRGEKRL